MSQEPPGHNPDPRTGGSRRAGGQALRWGLIAVAAAAWLATMARLVHSEVLTHRESADVRDLVASARLTRQHASSRHVIRAGEAVIGRLASVVSGSRDEEQLAYIVDGELHGPLSVRLKAVVIASWDRRVERFVMDADVGGARHRFDGQRHAEDGSFEVRHRAPGVATPATWLLGDAPVLAAGPLPIPAFAREALDEPRHGEAPDPLGGAMTWDLRPASWETMDFGGRERRVRRQTLNVGAATVVLLTEDSGFPLRIELPGGLVMELAEDGE